MYPNQRIIYIKRSSQKVKKDYLKIGHSNLDKVIKDLSGSSLKLYLYFLNNKDGFRLELSSAHFCNWANVSMSSYNRAFKELEEKKYLVKTNENKNSYVFVEASESFMERFSENDIIKVVDTKDYDKLLKT